jgi:hypothetical protein
MACHFDLKPCFALCLLLLIPMIAGCLNARFEKISKGADVPAPSTGLKVGQATLTDALKQYGAPADIVDMNGKVALIYKKSFYQGGQISIGIPLSGLSFPSSLRMEATGSLMRHDLLALFFTPDGILSETMYERGASQPFWESFWK